MSASIINQDPARYWRVFQWAPDQPLGLLGEYRKEYQISGTAIWTGMEGIRAPGVKDVWNEKKLEEALALVDVKPVESMSGLYADLKGDILIAQGKRAEARSAYQLALDRSEAGSLYRGTLQLKLDALGDAAPAAK